MEKILPREKVSAQVGSPGAQGKSFHLSASRLCMEQVNEVGVLIAALRLFKAHGTCHMQLLVDQQLYSLFFLRSRPQHLALQVLYSSMTCCFVQALCKELTSDFQCSTQLRSFIILTALVMTVGF